jgi:hypothetical protein
LKGQGDPYWTVLLYGESQDAYSTRRQAEAEAKRLNKEDPKSARVIHVRPRY